MHCHKDVILFNIAIACDYSQHFSQTQKWHGISVYERELYAYRTIERAEKYKNDFVYVQIEDRLLDENKILSIHVVFI